MNEATSSQQRIVPPGMAAGVPIVGQGGAPEQSPIVTPGGQPAASHPSHPSRAAPPANPLAREHTLTFDRAEIDAAVDAQLRKLQPKAEARGFRKGRVPLDVMRRHFGPKRLGEELTRRAEKRFNEEKQKTGEHIVGGAGSLRLVSAAPAENGDYRIRCGYEVFPDVAPPDFSNVRVSRPVVPIGEAEVERMIERLRNERGQFVAVDRAAGENDMVTVDYQATERGARVDGAANRKWLLGSPQMDAVSEALAGARAGDVRSLDLNHGADHPDPEWRGRRVRMRVSVKEVSELRLPELNGEFFALFGVAEGGMDAFRKKVREMTESESRKRVEMTVRERALTALSAATPHFPLPHILVQSEAALLRRQDMEIARQQGLPDAAVNANTAQYAFVAARRVRSGLVVDAWRRRENIAPTREEVEERLAEVALGYDDPEDFKTRARANPEIMGNVELQIVEDRAAEWAEARAQKTEQPLTMEQLWGWEEIPPETAASANPVAPTQPTPTQPTQSIQPKPSASVDSAAGESAEVRNG